MEDTKDRNVKPLSTSSVIEIAAKRIRESITDSNKYVVVDSFFPSSFFNDTMAEFLRTRATSHYNAIFQEKGGFNDNKRKMITGTCVSNDKNISVLISPFDSLVGQLCLAIGGTKLIKSGCSILYCLPNCSRQDTHTDFPIVEKYLDSTKKSYVIVAALTHCCRLYVYDEHNKRDKLITIGKGGIFVGRGDVKHAGADYYRDSNNVRLHWYLDFPGNGRVMGQTYIDFKVFDLYSSSQPVLNIEETKEKYKRACEHKIAIIKNVKEGHENHKKKKLRKLNNFKRN
jgi:hypothetical protein